MTKLGQLQQLTSLALTDFLYVKGASGPTDGQILVSDFLKSLFSWTDYTGSSTIVGWSSFFNQYIRFMLLGKICFINFALDGVSNSTNASFTVPFTSANLGTGENIDTASGLVIDNGVQQADPARIYIGGNSNVCNLAKAMGTASWTNSGNKLVRGIFFYEIQ